VWGKKPKTKRQTPKKKIGKQKKPKEAAEQDTQEQQEVEDTSKTPTKQSLPHKKQQQLRNASRLPPSQPPQQLSEQQVPPPQPEQKIKLEFLKPVILKRSELERWYGEPFFAKAVIGMFVRVVLKGSGTRRYALAEITAVVDSPHYKLITKSKECTHQLTLAIGNKAKNFQINLVSNGDLDDREFHFWYRFLEKNRFTFPTVDDIDKLKDQKKGAENYTYTTEDFEKSIQKFREKKILCR